MSATTHANKYTERLSDTTTEAYRLISSSGDDFIIKELAKMVIDCFVDAISRDRIDFFDRIDNATIAAKAKDGPIATSGLKFKSHHRHCAEKMAKTALMEARRVIKGHKTPQQADRFMRSEISKRKDNYINRKAIARRRNEEQSRKASRRMRGSGMRWSSAA